MISCHLTICIITTQFNKFVLFSLCIPLSHTQYTCMTDTIHKEIENKSIYIVDGKIKDC